MGWAATDPFSRRVAALPHLGLGLSTEYGASSSGLRSVDVRDVAAFLELGVDLERGLDADARDWVARGWPTTWHFLDVNLEEPEDLDPDWVRGTTDGARAAGAAWICGDAGLWHVGPRDRGHGTLLPPVMCAASARSLAGAVRALREATGLEVLPENPPAHVLVGDLHPLAYFGAVGELADCGLLLDLSHLAIVQRALGLRPDSLLDAFPVERVVELHVAGGRPFASGARELLDDDHGPHVADDVWALLDRLVPRLTALRAVVVECERNPPEVVRALFAQVRGAVAPALSGRPPVEPPTVEVPDGPPVDHRGVQRTLFRMLLDPAFARSVRGGAPLPLGEREAGWLRGLEADLVAADPGGRRRDQLLGNVGLEFLHTVRLAPPFLEDFTGSPELHDALAHDRPLPLAFAAFADRVLPPGPWRDLLALDTAMARLRRGVGDPAPGFAPGACVVALPTGTVGAAEALRAGLPVPPRESGREHVLLVRAGRDVTVEVLSDALADLLGGPRDDAGLAAFAARHDATPDEVAALVADLVRDGVLSAPSERPRRASRARPPPTSPS